MTIPTFETEEDQRFYVLGLRINKALLQGVVTEAEAQEALVRAGFADSPEDCSVTDEGLSLWQWLDSAYKRAEAAEKRHAEGRELAQLMESGHLTEAVVKQALRGVRGKSPDGAAIVAEVAARIREARAPKAKAA